MSDKRGSAQAFAEGVELMKRLVRENPDLDRDHLLRHAEIWDGVVWEASQAVSAQANDDALRAMIRQRLAVETVDEVLDALAGEAGDNWDMVRLAQLAGPEAYAQACAREAREMEQQAIGLDQIAGLWNEFGRPSVSGLNWSPPVLRKLIDSL